MGLLTAWSVIHSDYEQVILKHSDSAFPFKTWNTQEQQRALTEERLINLKLKTIFYHRVLWRRRHYQKLLDTSTG